MIKIIAANTIASYTLIEHLATTIWHEHYTSIIGQDQVEYMIRKFQTTTAIKAQVKQGYCYYAIYYNDIAAGYLSIKKEGDALFLSKIYIQKEYRGKGLGKTAMAFIEQQAFKQNCAKITLTVNIHNSKSIKAYENMGFANTGSIVQDIGNGFVMDDYTMEKTI
jgi:diamine N-acetyltransferase